MENPNDSMQQDFEQRRLAEMKQEQGRRRNAGGGCLGNLVRVIVILILGLAFAAGADYVDAPWSWGVTGRPTLTGEWVGTFKLPQRQTGAAYLNLTHDYNLNHDVRDAYGIHHLPPFGGSAQGCFSASGIQKYVLDGGATAGGDDVEMTFSAQKPTVPEYALRYLKGAWNDSTLTLSGTFTTILDTHGSTQSNGQLNQTQPTTIVFHKAGQADFASACQALQ
jgi:hypothetical protein